MRVLTLNLWCRHGAWDERRAALRAGLQELRPDLVALQETVVHDGYDQVAELLGPGFTIVHQPGRGPDGSGASLASRWPLGELRSAELHAQRINVSVDGGHVILTGTVPTLAEKLAAAAAAWRAKGVTRVINEIEVRPI